MKFADCQGFGGGMARGAVEAGLEMVAKLEEPAGFGVGNCEDNRHLLPGPWEPQTVSPDQWEPADEDIVLSNPPCSAFSVASAPQSQITSKTRGVDSDINNCMRYFADYVARSPAKAAAMESVQSAYTSGYSLMQEIWAKAKMEYAYHLRYNPLSIGGCQRRPRYFLVLSDEPLYWPLSMLDYCEVSAVPYMADAIGDLTGDGGDATWWSYLRRENYHVQPLGMVELKYTPGMRGAIDLIEAGFDWAPGAGIAEAVGAALEDGRPLPEFWTQDRITKATGSPAALPALHINRVRPNKASPVVHGQWMVKALHYSEARFFTARETARLMGFPDAWDVGRYTAHKNNAMVFGKAVTVETGRMVASILRDNLSGSPPGTWPGEELGQNEYLVDFSADHKAIYNERTGERCDARSAASKKQHERRTMTGVKAKRPKSPQPQVKAVADTYSDAAIAGAVVADELAAALTTTAEGESMANAKGQAVDTTELPMSQIDRGRVHRDYFAHHVRHRLVASYCRHKRSNDVHVLDIGCGSKMPLAQIFFNSPGNKVLSYTGVDYGKIDDVFADRPAQSVVHRYEQTDAVELLTDMGIRDINADVVVMLEVAEHVEPPMMLALLDRIKACIEAKPQARAYISTPIWNRKTVADNHVNEMTYDSFGTILEDRFTIVDHWAAFASQPEYKPHLAELGLTEVYEKMKARLHPDDLSVFMAPILPPRLGRNCIWALEHHVDGAPKQFPDLLSCERPWGSSDRWADMWHAQQPQQ